MNRASSRKKRNGETVVNWGLLSLADQKKKRKKCCNAVSAKIYLIHLQTVSAVLQNGVYANITISNHWVET